MTKQYISDIISVSEILKWKPGDRILITSQTGSGKSQWVKDQLYSYCKDNNKKILLLSNRSILRDQNKTEIEAENKQDIITLKNYQTLETAFIYGKTVLDLFNAYDFIVYDEAHYVFSDSQFNTNTDILMEPIIDSPKDKIFLFLTATPQALRIYSSKYDYEYTAKTDYSYIENLYFYSQTQTIENIIRTIPAEDKAIYFGDAKESLELSEQFDNSAFLCSDKNSIFKRNSSKKVQDQIINTNRFECQFLFSTKVLDNGINIIMPELKYVFIDMNDPIDVIQCLGRKRIVSLTDRVNLYIKDMKGNNLYPLLKKMRIRLNLVAEQEEIGSEAFLNKYARLHFDDIIMHNGEVNNAKFIYSKYIIDIYSRMLGDKNKKGFQNYISNMLRWNKENTKDAEQCYEKESIELLLQSYVGRNLYGNDIETFKNIFFQNIFAPKRKINIRRRGYRCINSILMEDNLPYSIDTRTEKTKEHRDQTVWRVQPWSDNRSD